MASATLADPDQFASVEQDLARTQPVETHRRRPRCRLHGASMHIELPVTCGHIEGIDQVLAEPHHRAVHIVRPARRAGRNDDVEPRDLVRDEQHRSPTTPATYHLDARSTACLVIDHIVALRGSQHECRSGDFVPPHRLRRGIRYDTVMELLCSGSRSRQPVLAGHRQDANGRYWRQVSGTPLTDTTTQAVARGARQGRANRIPASSGVRSRLPRLHGRQAAATFSQLCGPPFDLGTTWSIESARSPQYWQR